MKRQVIQVGPTPCEERCAQVGSPGYRDRAVAECNGYMTMLDARFPGRPAGVVFGVGANPHDSGTYYEVELRFDGENRDHWAYVSFVDRNVPETWDDVAVLNWR